MNRLILIGNGFDLAHNMKTSYGDFVKDYLYNAINQFIKSGNQENYSDTLIDIIPNPIYLEKITDEVKHDNVFSIIKKNLNVKVRSLIMQLEFTLSIN